MNATNSTNTTSTLSSATAHAAGIATAINSAMASAPFAPFAADLVALHEAGDAASVHSACMTLILGVQTATGWNTARTAVTQALKRAGYTFASVADYRTRERPTKAFALATLADVKAAKAAADEQAEQTARELEARAAADRAQAQAERDAALTPADLVAGLLSECARLGIDPAECSRLLAESQAMRVLSMGDWQAMAANIPSPVPAPAAKPKRSAA